MEVAGAVGHHPAPDRREEATVTIEIEPGELVDVRPCVVSDDEDVAGALFDIVPPSEDADPSPDRIALVPMAHPGEDELSLWFG